MPLKPFAGTIGLAPAEPGLHSIVPPRRCGGNMDIRDLAAGTELYLPVEVAGALFSVGDTHAAQGDGEVCGTAIESPMSVALRFDLVKGANLRAPRFTTPGPVSRHLDGAGYEATTGIGPDLMQAARDAVSAMIDLLAHALRHAPGRGLHAVQRLRRPADQRDRRHAQLGGVALLPAPRPAVTGGAGAAIATAAAPSLELEGLEVGFRTETGLERPSSRGSAFDSPRGASWAWSASSGCGKSVTARAIMRLLPEPPAKVRARRLDVAGPDLLRMSERAMRAIRGNPVAMIFQEPMTSLNPTWTVGYQIDESLRLHTELGAGDRRARALDLLRRVGVGRAERRLAQYPFELSGGLRQRVMIAMALACGPRLLIADEPTTALDVTVQAQILDLLAELREELGMAILLITHDLGVVAELCDEVAVMYAGRIVEQAPVQELFARPRHPYTAGLLAAMPRLDRGRGRLATIPGTVPPPGFRPPGCVFRAPLRPQPRPLRRRDAAARGAMRRATPAPAGTPCDGRRRAAARGRGAGHQLSRSRAAAEFTP